MSVDPLLQGLVTGFAAEAQEVCQKVTMDLLDLERGVLEAEALTKAYARLGRHLHTLKGSAASLGLQDLSSIAHKLEDALAPLRKDIKPMPRPMVDMLLHGLDLFLLRAQAHAEGPVTQVLMSGSRQIIHLIDLPRLFASASGVRNVG